MFRSVSFLPPHPIHVLLTSMTHVDIAEISMMFLDVFVNSLDHGCFAFFFSPHPIHLFLVFALLSPAPALSTYHGIRISDPRSHSRHALLPRRPPRRFFRVLHGFSAGKLGHVFPSFVKFLRGWYWMPFFMLAFCWQSPSCAWLLTSMTQGVAYTGGILVLMRFESIQ